MFGRLPRAETVIQRTGPVRFVARSTAGDEQHGAQPALLSTAERNSGRIGAGSAEADRQRLRHDSVDLFVRFVTHLVVRALEIDRDAGRWLREQWEWFGFDGSSIGIL